MRTIKPLPLIAGIVAVVASAVFWLMYAANGIAYGSLVGLKGRGHDMQVMASRGTTAFVIASVFQVVAWFALGFSRSHVGETSLRNRIATWALVIPVSLAGTAVLIELLVFLDRLFKVV
jgi:hypothetical protein